MAISIFWPVQNDFLTILRKSFFFLMIFEKNRKSSKIIQKWRFWHKRTSGTWFSWKNHPDWYRRNQFSTHGDPFYDFFWFVMIFKLLCFFVFIGFCGWSWTQRRRRLDGSTLFFENVSHSHAESNSPIAPAPRPGPVRASGSLFYHY